MRVDEPLQVRLDGDESMDWSLMISAGALVLAILVAGRDVARAWRQRQNARRDAARRVVAWVEIAPPIGGNSGTIRAVVHNGTDAPVFDVSVTHDVKRDGVTTTVDEREVVVLPGRHEFSSTPLVKTDGQPVRAGSELAGVMFTNLDGERWRTAGTSLERWSSGRQTMRSRVRGLWRWVISRR